MEGSREGVTRGAGVQIPGLTVAWWRRNEWDEVPRLRHVTRSQQETVVPTLLLETKLYVPRSPRGLVPRPRLSERLDRGAASKLTLVSAPAGFGKTTLLAEWLAADRPRRR